MKEDPALVAAMKPVEIWSSFAESSGAGTLLTLAHYVPTSSAAFVLVWAHGYLGPQGKNSYWSVAAWLSLIPLL